RCPKHDPGGNAQVELQFAVRHLGNKRKPTTNHGENQDSYAVHGQQRAWRHDGSLISSAVGESWYSFVIPGIDLYYHLILRDGHRGDVHESGVQVDAGIESMLAVIKAHHGLLGLRA